MTLTRIRTHIELRSIIALLGVAAVSLVLWLVLAPAANAVESSSDSVGFAVSPLKFDTDIKPGASVVQQITITNTDTRAATFTFSKEDFEGSKDDPAATPVMLGGKFSSAISGYDWLSTPDAVTIPAGDSKTVNVRVSAPNGATGGHYAALMVTGPARSADDVIAQSRIGVLFMMNAGGTPPPDIVITEIVTTTDGGTKIIYDNNGSTAVDPTPGTSTDPDGKHPIKPVRPGHCSTALPGGSGECYVPPADGTQSSGSGEGGGIVNGLLGKKPAKYFNLDDSKSGAKTGEQIPTEWSGTWTSLLLPLVGIALFVMYFLFLRRRRKKDEEGGGGSGTDFDPWAPVPLS